MSRAFVNEDAGDGPLPRHRFPLPPRDDPTFDDAAARALLQGAHEGDSLAAEEATGIRFGDPRLRVAVARILADAQAQGNERLEQLAERYLRRSARWP